MRITKTAVFAAALSLTSASVSLRGGPEILRGGPLHAAEVSASEIERALSSPGDSPI